MFIRILDPNRPTQIHDLDILKYGFEKAYILGRIPEITHPDGSLPKKHELHTFFKIFSKKKFNRVLQELIDCGALCQKEENENE